MGGSAEDTLSGRAGNDSIYGLDGGDELYGGTGADGLYGGAGGDAASGGAGHDVLDGGSGDDTLVGGQGIDTFYGGAGNDTLVGDGQWMDTASMASSGGGQPTTLSVINNADGPIKLWWLDAQGYPQFVATISAGQTFTLSTMSTNNYVLLDNQNYYLDAIPGGSGQTFTYAAPLGDLAYGGANDDLIVSQYGDDTVYGDDGNDTAYGGYGKDVIFGGAGNDSLLGEAGDDSVFGGAGNDTVALGDGADSFGSWSSFETGDDRIDAGLGNDSINGGAGNDSVYGGAGDDWLTGSLGNDKLYGGSGSDSFAIAGDHQGDAIWGGESSGDSDLITFTDASTTHGVIVNFTGTETGSYLYQGGASGTFSEIEAVAGTDSGDTLNAASATGNVQLFGMAGDDNLIGGAGNDTLFFGSGNDSVVGGVGRDLIDDTAQGIENGNNFLDGGSGNDTLWAGGGNDSALGSAGDDLLFGEAGSDTLSGGAGADTLSGGAGNDTFELQTAGGGDVICDFDAAFTGGVTADQLDVSDLLNADGSAVRAWDVRVNDNGDGHAVLTFPGGESVVLNGVSPAFVAQPGVLHAMGVPCFAAGTRILTPHGERAVEHLVVGDLVITAAGKPEQVLWCGHRTIANLADQPHLRPIRLAAGVLGASRPLTLSPQHAVCLPGAAGPVLLRARHLAELHPLATVAQDLRSVEYHHFLLPQHALVFAQGVPVESFFPGAAGLAALTPADVQRLRQAILCACAPNVEDARQSLAQLYGPRCLPLLSRREAKALYAHSLRKPDPRFHGKWGIGESVSATTLG